MKSLTKIYLLVGLVLGILIPKMEVSAGTQTYRGRLVENSPICHGWGMSHVDACQFVYDVYAFQISVEGVYSFNSVQTYDGTLDLYVDNYDLRNWEDTTNLIAVSYECEGDQKAACFEAALQPNRIYFLLTGTY